MTETLKRAKLVVIPTPIGNLEDFSPRSKKTLFSCDLIACEDTRVTAKLLHLLESPKKIPLKSYHNHNEGPRSVELVQKALDENLVLGLVSDAGTPAVSDPGFRLIDEAHRKGLAVESLPGPSAFLTLVAASGLASDRLLFVGFLPNKESKLKDEVLSWSQSKASVVFFESPRRIVSSLENIAALAPEAVVCLGRELTKMYEEIHRLPIQEMITWLSAKEVLKGEIVCMLSLGEIITSDADPLAECVHEIESLLAQGLRLKDAINRVKRPPQMSKKELYQLMQKKETP